jgi:hypothetical protein
LGSAVFVVVEDVELGGLVDSPSVCCCGAGEQVHGGGEVLDDLADLVFGHALAGGEAAKADLGAFAFGSGSFDLAGSCGRR